MKKNKIKALVVFSGGLDSLLAVKTLEVQGIETQAICFESPFYKADKAREAAERYYLDLRVVDISEEMFALSKNPPHGYGKNMNPCIDCHAMMFHRAGKYMRKEGYHILASGEVLGQRPFSQKKESLERVMDIAGLEVLRPLSAKLLPETTYEKEGLVDRGKLHALMGRGREGQFALAKEYGLDVYPSPAGGCLLTDPGFSQRYKELLSHQPDCSAKDIELLRFGRMFWVGDSLLIVGRHQEDNDNLERLAQKGDIVLQLRDYNGPLAIIRFFPFLVPDMLEVSVPSEEPMLPATVDSERSTIEIASKVAYFCTKARGQKAQVELLQRSEL